MEKGKQEAVLVKFPTDLKSVVMAHFEQQIYELGNKQTTTLVFKNKNFSLKKELN